jgi:hypothetical protein
MPRLRRHGRIAPLLCACERQHKWLSVGLSSRKTWTVPSDFSLNVRTALG